MFVVKFVEQSLAASRPTIIIFGSLNFYPFILKAIWQLDIQWICLPGEYGWPDQEQIWCQSSSPYTEAGRDQSDSGAAGVPWWKVYPSSNPASGLGNPGPDPCSSSLRCDALAARRTPLRRTKPGIESNIKLKSSLSYHNFAILSVWDIIWYVVSS